MSTRASLITAITVFGLFAGCSQKNEYAEPPLPKVTVAQPLQQEVTDYLQFTGTTHASASVDVNARVKGYLESMHFTPGELVSAGDLLFVIDDREYQAALNAAKAELEAAKAQLKRADIEQERAKRLFKQKAGSESDVVKWRGEREVAKAAIMHAEAIIEDAKLNLSYTQVTAPIAGRVSRNLVDTGNLVGDKEATLLTTVVQYAPMYVYFNLNERDLLTALDLYKERVSEEGVAPSESGIKKAKIPLYLGLANEEGYPHEGLLDFADSSVDQETGTLQLRGIFDNGEQPPALYPGLFARLRMPIRNQQGALLVTARAIGADQGGQYLLVVNQENVVEKRSIRKQQLVDGLHVIAEGLGANERVVVKGLQRARPGAKVEPEQIEMSTLTTSALRAEKENESSAQSAKGKETVAAGTMGKETSETEDDAADATEMLAEKTETTNAEAADKTKTP